MIKWIICSAIYFFLKTVLGDKAFTALLAFGAICNMIIFKAGLPTWVILAMLACQAIPESKPSDSASSAP